MIKVYNLYTEKDINAINNELDNIIEKVNDIKLHTFEPTIDECYKVRDDVKKFVKAKKRIIYGGTAWDELIKTKDPNDRIYTDKECKDVEFYTHKPIEDLVELSQYLNKKYKYVRVSGAMHPETFTIFVNFSPMCDITYMPGPIFNSIKKLNVNGFYYIHPSVILIDILRQYNDPINSYWRLKEKKTFYRANKILKHFPLELEKGDIKQTNVNKEIIEYVFENIKTINSLIFILPSFYLNPNSENIILNNKLIVFTDNYKNDSKLIYSIILKYFASKNILNMVEDFIKIEEHVPFFQYWDTRLIFKYEGTPFLEIYGHNQICIPYHKVYVNKNKIDKIIFGLDNLKKSNDYNMIKLGTFIMVLNYYLIDYHYNYIYSKHICNDIRIIISSLLQTREKYLKKNKLTVIDKSPFQEFIIECYGYTVDPVREKFLRQHKNKEKGVKITFSYDPNNEQKPENIIFKNTSGNINNKGYKWLFQ